MALPLRPSPPLTHTFFTSNPPYSAYSPYSPHNPYSCYSRYSLFLPARPRMHRTFWLMGASAMRHGGSALSVG